MAANETVTPKNSVAKTETESPGTFENPDDTNQGFQLNRLEELMVNMSITEQSGSLKNSLLSKMKTILSPQKKRFEEHANNISLEAGKELPADYLRAALIAALRLLEVAEDVIQDNSYFLNVYSERLKLNQSDVTLTT